MRNERCGKCRNCQELQHVRHAVLRAVNPPFSHACDGVIDLWNGELARLPCLREEPEKEA